MDHPERDRHGNDVAVVLGYVLILVALVLSASGDFERVLPVVVGSGAAGTLMVLGGIAGRAVSRNRRETAPERP